MPGRDADGSKLIHPSVLGKLRKKGFMRTSKTLSALSHLGTFSPSMQQSLDLSTEKSNAKTDLVTGRGEGMLPPDNDVSSPRP